MSMTLTSRREFYKLRELVHFLLAGAGATPRTGERGSFICCFCRKELDDYTDFVKHGNATGPKFLAKLTIHHVNEDHQDNRLENKALCHTSCHKSHHRTMANKVRTLMRAQHVEGD